ncbi:MAG: hypothetical protein U9R37_09140 [Campylobacterota bacterium]|nr:hypothetical protein [Campylobacterota bacterium]
MENFCEQLIENDLNPFLLFDSNGKVKSYNKEAEFLLNFASVKELFDLAITNASKSFGFQHKYLTLKFNKQSYYAILVGYICEDEIALRLYKVISIQANTIDSKQLKSVNIFSLIDLSKNSNLLNSNLQINELYDISIPEMKLNINQFLLCLNECFSIFKDDDEVTLKVQIKIGEYEIINQTKYKIIAIEFISYKLIENIKELEHKISGYNINIFINKNILKLELPMIL